MLSPGSRASAETYHLVFCCKWQKSLLLSAFGRFFFAPSWLCGNVLQNPVTC
jgi:hypothetical protein